MFFASSKSRKRAKIWYNGVSKASDHIQIKIKMPNPSEEPQASSKAPNEDFNVIDVLVLKIKVEQKFRTWVYQRPVNIYKSR